MPLDPDIIATAEQVRKLFDAAIDKIVSGSEEALKSTEDPAKPRLFFPNGIELIYLKFKVGDKIDIALTIAGKDAPMKVPAVVSSSVQPLAQENGGWVSSG
jgi:hypothetical protein